MKDKKRSISAVLAVFPTRDHLISYLKENPANQNTVQSLVQFACRNDAIEEPEIAALEALIDMNSRSREECQPPGDLNFESFLERKKEILRINLSIRSLTDHINSLLAEQCIDLPKVDKSMLSRLKKEPADNHHKQNVLRSLAFWLGHQRMELGPAWNYETLLQLCREKKLEINFKEGVRIGFALYSRGDTIDSEVVGWLKKKIKEYIDQSAHSVLNRHWEKVHSYDITTFYVDFPKEDASSGPASYRLCLMKVLSLAYQITISWALSKYCTRNRFLPIGIVAGEFATADNQLLHLLNAKLPYDPVIRVSDFVRQCIFFSDIRVLLCRQAHEVMLLNGEQMNIWWLTGVWSPLYFDFIPELVHDPLLKNNAAAVEALTKLLWSPLVDGNSSTFEPSSVGAFLKSPQNAMLGIEIAKTLYCRKRFRETSEILRIVLSVSPANLIARTFRIMLLRSLARDASDFVTAEYFFREAIQEGEYILKNCDFPPEDFYCEYGNLYLCRAMLKVQYLRDKKIPKEFGKKSQIAESVHRDLETAETIYEKAFIVSPTGIRSHYFLATLRALRNILDSNERTWSNPAYPLSINRVLYQRLNKQILCQIGFPTDPEFIGPVHHRRFQFHDDAISLDSYRCASLYCHAITCWDTMATPTVALVRTAIAVLEIAIAMARNLEKNDFYVYSFDRLSGGLITPASFIEHVEACIAMIKKHVKGDLSKKHDHEVIKLDPDTPLLLTYMP